MADFPEPLWLASTEHPDWGAPRRAHPRSFLAGPDPRRQYLWLKLGPPEPGGGGGQAAAPASDVVVTPRHHYEFVPLDEKNPLHVHLWVVSDPGEVAAGRFTRQGSADAWSALWASLAEAHTRGAEAW